MMTMLLTKINPALMTRQVSEIAMLEEGIQFHITSLNPHGCGLSIIMCDIDNFKKYNDKYGDVEGDACLRKVAQCIQNSLKRPIDFCARYGGEEFVVVLPQSSLNGVITVAERIRENIENMKIEHIESCTGGIVTMSLGVATSKIVNVESYEQLIQHAEEALYVAKKIGRNKVYHFVAGTENIS